MLQSPALPQPRLRQRPLVGTPIWLVLGVVGWAGVVYLGARLFALVPPQAGFDLELLLNAGRRVAAGLSPYDSSLVAGHAPAAEDLFYSYPPPVAQYLSLFAGVPSSVMLVAWSVVAALGVGFVATVLARVLNPAEAPDGGSAIRRAGLPALAVVAFVFPFEIAILFGNADVIFPLAYGLMLLGVLVDRPAARFGAGAALGLVSIAKLHPATLGVWFLVRGFGERRRSAAAKTAAEPPATAARPLADGSARRPVRRSLPEPRGVPKAWRVLSAAVAVGLVTVTISLVVGGFGLWQDFLAVVRAGSSATLIDARNVGPASQLAGLLGGGESLARSLQAMVSLVALAATALAAWSLRDPIESFAWASVASLVVLPVTWFHYPVALLPVAFASVARVGPGPSRRRVIQLLGAALVVAALSIVLPVAVWLAVALVLAAVRAGASSPSQALAAS